MSFPLLIKAAVVAAVGFIAATGLAGLTPHAVRKQQSSISRPLERDLAAPVSHLLADVLTGSLKVDVKEIDGWRAVAGASRAEVLPMLRRQLARDVALGNITGPAASDLLEAATAELHPR